MKTPDALLDWPALIGAQAMVSLVPESLREQARHVKLDAREMLFRAGARVRHVYWVISGEVRLVRLSRGGGEVILQRSSGGFMAEASVDSYTYHCDAIAAEPTELLTEIAR